MLFPALHPRPPLVLLSSWAMGASSTSPPCGPALPPLEVRRPLLVGRSVAKYCQGDSMWTRPLPEQTQVRQTAYHRKSEKWAVQSVTHIQEALQPRSKMRQERVCLCDTSRNADFQIGWVSLGWWALWPRSCQVPGLPSTALTEPPDQYEIAKSMWVPSPPALPWDLSEAAKRHLVCSCVIWFAEGLDWVNLLKMLIHL